MDNPFESMIGLIMAFAMIPVIIVTVLVLMHWMVTGEISGGAGIAAIVVVVVVSFATVMSQSSFAVGAVLMCLVTLMVFFPYASDQLAPEGTVPAVTLGKTARISFVRDPDGNWIELSQRASLTGPLSS